MNHRHRTAISLFAILVMAGLLSLASRYSLVTAQEVSAPNAARPVTVAAVAMTNYDNLVRDINFLGSLSGQADTGGVLEALDMMFMQGQGMAGLDKTKPWGIVFTTDGENFKPVSCVPVSNARDILAMLVPWGIKANDLGDGVIEVTIPDKDPLYVKSADGWAFLSDDRANLNPLPHNPEKDLAPLVKEYDLAARLSVQKIPAGYREDAIKQLREGMAEGLQRDEDEDDEEYELRRRWAESQMETFVRLIEEIDEVTLGWAVDADRQRTYLDFAYTVVPQSTMAQLVNSLAEGSQTNFFGFRKPEMAACANFVNKTDPKLNENNIEEMRAGIRTLKEKVAKEIDDSDELPDSPQARQQMKLAINQIIDALQATVETGQIDGGVVLQLYPNSLTLVAGGHVKDPSAVEEAFRKLAGVAEQEPDFPGVSWNADNHAGFTFHTMQCPVKEDDDVGRQLFGPTMDVSLGVGAKAVYFCIGRDHLAVAKGVIDASAAEPNKTMPPSEMLISLAPIMETAATFRDEEDEQRQMMEMFATALRNEAPGRDHIRIVANVGENRITYRLEAEEGVLKALGSAAQTAMQPPAGAPGGPGAPGAF